MADGRGSGNTIQLVAANKIDALDEPARLAALQARAAELALPCLSISAVAGTGVTALLEAAWPHVAAARDAALLLAADDDAGPAGRDR